jgi:hypothetical protein
LHARGTANELAELAWKAAREGQPWAIQMIYNRLEPQPAQLNLTHEEHNENRIDEGTRNLPEQAGAFIWR